VSPETLTIILSAIGVVLTLTTSLFAAGAWMVRRIDDRIDAVDEKLSTRIDAVDEKLSTRIDAVDDKLSARIDAIATDVTDLKIAVARLEGPPRHLLTASR
jgi:outer membrane murein-binding lipoprotein Lpp